MKKQLLFGAVLLGSLTTVTAQDLQSENFNGLTVGNITEVIDGSEPGQGGFYLETTNGTAPTTSTNAAATNAQIVNVGGDHQMAIQIEGANGDKGGRFLWKDGLDVVWASRTEGNDIIELEADIFTGPASTSRNTFGLNIYNESYQVICGFAVRASTKELLLVAYSTPTGNPAGNYNYSLAAAPGIVLPADAWSRIGVSYNKTTGAVIIKGPGVAPAGVGVMSSTTGDGTDPFELDIVSGAGSAAAPNTNTSSAIMHIDNITSKATATDTLLGTDAVIAAPSKFSVYPNPATNVINISNADNILVNGVQIVDLNGRTVKSVQFDGVTEAQVNVSDLATGMYMMTVSSDKGTMTQKIVKN